MRNALGIGNEWKKNQFLGRDLATLYDRDTTNAFGAYIRQRFGEDPSKYPLIVRVTTTLREIDEALRNKQLS
jgi:hypothetical protein